MTILSGTPTSSSSKAKVKVTASSVSSSSSSLFYGSASSLEANGVSPREYVYGEAFRVQQYGTVGRSNSAAKRRAGSTGGRPRKERSSSCSMSLTTSFTGEVSSVDYGFGGRGHRNAEVGRKTGNLDFDLKAETDRLMGRTEELCGSAVDGQSASQKEWVI